MGEWSLSHLIVVGIAVATIIGQLIVVLTRLNTITKQLEKQTEKLGETFFHALERLEERMDKWLLEVNQRLSDMQAETNHRFAEVNQRLSDMNAEIRQLNQNHIEHLNRHH